MWTTIKHESKSHAEFTIVGSDRAGKHHEPQDEREVMRKILIVGHPSSQYRGVELLLRGCGLAEAKPSRREGMTPVEIGATLMKAHGLRPSEGLLDSEGMGPVQTAPVWNGMALDLMLGNLDQELWGWSDPQAIYFLDYWKALDPNITFLLVYDGPRTALAVGQDDVAVTPDAVEERVRSWCAFNAELLRFFHRNGDRALLVHARQVGRSERRCVQEICAHVETTSGEITGPRSGPATERLPGSLFEAALDLVPALEDIETSMGFPAADEQEDPLERYLADQVLQRYPEAQIIYEELQSVASLPRVNGTSHDVGAEDTGERDSGWLVLAAYQSMVKRERLTRRQGADLARARAEAERTATELREERERLSELRAQAALDEEDARKRVSELRRRLADKGKLEKQATEQREEVAELRRELAESESLAAKTQSELQGIQRELEKLADQSKRDERLGRELEGQNQLLLEQLHQVQDELERYYLENRSTEGTGLVKAGDSCGTLAQYGAADRVKGWLSYRLGAVMIERSRSLGGWLTMPWALLREVRRFRRELPDRRAKKLPPIHRYADAEKAERVKRHLSYRLGSTLLAYARNPLLWLFLPFALLWQVRGFRASKKA